MEMEMDPPPPPLQADRRCREYLLALEEEQHKIRVFQRELPLCLDLVTQTIERMRSHMDGVGGGVSEETVSDHGGPVLEEFMPLKPTPLSSSSSSDDDDEHDSSHGHHQQQRAAAADATADENDEAPAGDPETAAASISSRQRLPEMPETKKALPDWLQSVQLWSSSTQQQHPSPSPPPHQHQQQDEMLLLPCRPVALNACRKPGVGAFQPFDKDKDKKADKEKQPLLPASSATAAASSVVIVGDSCDRPGAGGATDTDTTENNNNNSNSKASVKGGKDKEAQSSSQAPGRKPRRCWAPELHRRFLHALQQLGGSHAATPKQIRELMKVDGLTNDEVKSHLQKYRLHTKRPHSTALGVQSGGGTSGAPQFLVVGGIWVPPPEYAAAAAAAAAAAGVAQPQQAAHQAGDASGTTTTTANKVYAPVATTLTPRPLQPRPQRQSSSCSGSPAVSSSSSQTTSV